MWADAYVAYLEAGGLSVPDLRVEALRGGLETAFTPPSVPVTTPTGPALFLAALGGFFTVPPPVPGSPTNIKIPLLAAPTVPAVAEVFVSAFIPTVLPESLVLGLDENATRQDQANALASMIANLTLASTWVITVPVTGTPGPPTPLP